MARTKMATNPGPSTLLIVNPKKGKSMVTRRRRKTRRSNPKARRSTALVIAKRTNSRRRYRNPNLNTGLLSDALMLAAGSALTEFAAKSVPPIGGVTPLADAARTGAVAYLLGMAVSKLAGPKYGRFITLGGMALVGGKLIQSFLLPAASSVFQPRQAAAPAKQVNGNGVSDIVTVPRGSWDSYYGATPYFKTNAARGMADIVTLQRRASGY